MHTAWQLARRRNRPQVHARSSERRATPHSNGARRNRGTPGLLADGRNSKNDRALFGGSDGHRLDAPIADAATLRPVAHHGGVAGRARGSMRDAAAHRAVDDAGAEHGRAPRRNPLPGARLLGYQRSIQSSRRRDEDSRAMPPGALHAAQPMRPLGNGRASRPVQPHLPRLSPQRLSAQSGKRTLTDALSGIAWHASIQPCFKSFWSSTWFWRK